MELITLAEQIKTTSTKELRQTIRMGYNNLSGLKPEFQPDLKTRLEIMEKELEARA